MVYCQYPVQPNMFGSSLYVFCFFNKVDIVAQNCCTRRITSYLLFWTWCKDSIILLVKPVIPHRATTFTLRPLSLL